MIPFTQSVLRALVLLTLACPARPSAAGKGEAPGTALPARTGLPVKVWVTFTDKGPASASLARGSIAYEDLSVHAPYVAALGARGLVPDVRLKWQNRVSGYVDADSIAAIRGLSFVASVTLMPRKAKLPPPPASPFPWKPGALAKRAAEGLDYGAGRALMESLRVDKVHAYMTASGMPPGKGVRVAVIDADFHLGSPIFAAMKGRIKDQYDFVAGKPGAVTDSLLSSHGAQCMSLIGGNFPGTLVGAAPEADFLLYRAEEDEQERYVEEDFVAAAIERAVDSGAQVISVSLGYRYDFTDGSPDRPYAEFDGRTRPSSLAALGAARRNVLVSVAMGNESGNEPPTPTLNAPADADSILAVGIADRLRRRCSYSCTGPSADGRVKPDVMSMGVVGDCQVPVANTSSPLAETRAIGGTSFAAPVLAGVAALLRQLRPELTAEEIRQAIITTADHRSRPDSLVGNGLADAAAAARKLQVPINPPLSETGLARLYHSGGESPIVLGWDPGRPKPALQLIDLSGRRIPVTVRASGAVLVVAPEHSLRTGIYIARVH
ncbi:MAG TPA: S8 family serine peptidase [Fibrobacteria bacterium]|nr:S8 family serine peptidase [Fibrobacteria bacterium]